MQAGACNYVLKPLNRDEIAVYIFSAAKRRRLKAAVIRREKQLSALQIIGQEINKALDPIEVQDVIIKMALKLTEAHFGAILQWNTDNNALTFSRVYPPVEKLSLAAPIKQIPMQSGINGRIGITGRAAREKRTIYVSEVTQNPDYIAYIVDTQSELAVPLMYGDECIGVLDVEHREVDAFSEEDQEFLEALAHLAAIALRDYVNINRSLKIRFEPGLNFVVFASLFEPDVDVEMLVQGAKEFDNLFRKLLRDQIEVEVYDRLQGFEGTFFAHARLRSAGSKQPAERAIGCGKRSIFKQKRSNHHKCVCDFAGVQDAQEISFAETLHYAAAVYSLGNPIEKLSKVPPWVAAMNGESTWIQ
jgi:hypothetical protein